MSDHPQHDKLAAVAEQRDAVQEFIDWLGGAGYEIVRWHDNPVGGTPYATNPRPDALIAEHFGIDAAAFHAETDEIVRKVQEEANAR